LRRKRVLVLKEGEAITNGLQRAFRAPRKAWSLSKTLKDQFHLNLSRCRLNSIPNFKWLWKNLGNITYLNVAKNNLHVLPKELAYLKLRAFICSSNHLFSLPEICVEDLREIDISKNHFTEIPPIIFKARKLLSLYAEDLRIESISEEVNNLKELKTLFLDNCQLRVLPEGLWDLKELQSLRILRNQIRELSVKVLEMPQLDVFHHENNPWSKSALRTIKQFEDEAQ
jgi:Leucine-rich repeat (LRR) protein